MSGYDPNLTPRQSAETTPIPEAPDQLQLRVQRAVGEGYAVLSLLGRGGMGIVWRAKDRALDRDVALKVLAFDPELHPQAFQRFEREAKLAARLDHPHIVPIFAVGRGAGLAFYTMRLVKGGSLEERMNREPVLARHEIIRVLRETASALDFAHGLGVVHRDVKPANILLDGEGRALVADFGIARAFGGDDASTSTSTGVVGSPAYMSPEQWRGEKPDGRADQYALAIMAFELLAGRRPFTSVSMQELLRMHLAEDVPRIADFRRDLPDVVDAVLVRALAKEPSERFATCAAFVSALEDALLAPVRRQRPAAAVAAPATRALAGPAGELPARSMLRRWPLAAAALVILLGVLAVASSSRRRPEVTSTPPVPVSDSADAPSTKAPPVEVSVNVGSPTPVQQSDKGDSARAEEARADSVYAAGVLAEIARKAAQNPGGPTPEVSDLDLRRPGTILIVARGGTPAAYVDGRRVADVTPVFAPVRPGRHAVHVEGEVRYLPERATVQVGSGDTVRVLFRPMLGRRPPRD